MAANHPPPSPSLSTLLPRCPRLPACPDSVDDVRYRFEAILYVYLTWRDPDAYDTVHAATQRWLAGGAACSKECSDWTGALSCCDGIYMPTFFFRRGRQRGA